MIQATTTRPGPIRSSLVVILVIAMLTQSIMPMQVLATNYGGGEDNEPTCEEYYSNHRTTDGRLLPGEGPPDACGPCGSDGSGGCESTCQLQPGLSDAPVHFRRGSVVESETDLQLRGPTMSWAYSRSYDSGYSEASNGDRSIYWTRGPSNPRLIEVSFDTIDLLQTATSKRTFTGYPPTLTSPDDYDATLSEASETDTDDLDGDSNTSETIDVYTLTENTTGQVMIFLGFDNTVESEYRGKMIERTNRSYQAKGLSGVAYAYNTDGDVSVVTTAEPQSWRIDYTYTTAGGEKQIDKIEVRDGPLGTDTVIKKAEYTYYDEVSPANTDLGSNGDLVQVKVSKLAADGSSWIERYTQYRYHRSGGTDGEAHQLKMVFEADAVERTINGELAVTDEADMLSELDTVVSDYASRTFTYYTEDLATDNSGATKCVTPWSDTSGEDLSTAYGGSEFDEYNDTAAYGAVKTEAIGGCGSCGGSANGNKRTYFYMDLNGGTSSDPNKVVRIVIEDTEDGANPRVARYRRIYGLNFRSAAIREAFIEDPTQTTLNVWCQSKKLDSGLHLTEERMPSAHASKVDSNAEVKKFLNPTGGSVANQNDIDTVSSSAGVVYYYEYSSTYGDGNHVTGKLVREGAGTGSRYYLSATDWGKGSNDDEPTRLKLAEYVYPSKTTSRSDSSRIKIATYAYDFWDADDTAIKQFTKTLPAISTSQNGSGTATSTYQYFDEEGRLRWAKDGEGYVNYYSYHPNLGGRALTVIDVDTASLDSDITGTGSGKWVAWSGAAGLTRGSGLPTALELKEKAEFDDQGRTVKQIDRGGSEHYVRYEDQKTLRFSYWTGGTTGSAELPVEVTETNVAGQVRERYSVKPSKSQWNSGDGLPELASYTTADYVSRDVYSYNATDGRLSSVDRYYDADAASGGYYRTSYLYDDLGRRAATIQEVASSTYQVTARLLDVRGRVIETRRGVATAAPTDYGELDNDPPGTPTNFDGYATTAEVAYDSGGVGDGHVTSSKSYYGTGSSDYIESIPKLTFRGHSRGSLRKNGSTKFGPYGVQDIDWMGRTTATASYSTEPTTWPEDYSDYVINSSGASEDQPKTSGHFNVSVSNYDDLGRVYQTLQYPGTEATKHFESNNFFDRRSNLVASEQVNGTASEIAYDGAGRRYQSRTVLTLETTKYSSGAFNYRAPTPDPGYGVGSESSMSGGDDNVITLRHSVLADSGQVTESHTLEAHHDDTDGIDLSADDDYVRSCYRPN